MADNNSGEYVCLDTRVIKRCLDRKNEFIKKYNKINTKYTTLMSKIYWTGKGADAFFDDAQKVRTNLKGIADVLNGMCDTLKNCLDVIEETDKTLGEFNRNPEKT